MRYTSNIKKVVAGIIIFSASCAQLLASPVIPVPTQPQQFAYVTPTPPNLDASGYILIDATSGKVLAEKNADLRMPPASLTKLMSLYIISAALKNNSIHMDDKVRISSEAWKAEGSRMFVKVGDEVPVKDLLKGVVVASGNDATIALAEYVAGSEDSFTSMMNQQAKMLNMTNSHFMDSTGLPNKDHFSSARDLATLSRSYINTFPEDYSLYAEKWVAYNGIRQPNRNRLLWRYQYADGLKTGHTNEAGYCLVASAKKDGMRLISVVLGAPSDAARTEDSIRLLTYGFRFFQTHKLYNANTALMQVPVWQGQKSEIALGVADDFYITVPAGQYKRLQITTEVVNPLKAPVVQGQVYGKINVTLNNQLLASKPLIALDGTQQGGLLRRASDSVKFGIKKYFTRTDEKVNTG